MRGGHEPDDGVAMVQAFRSPELEIAGVSVVFGNAPFETGLPIARRIAAEYGPAGLSVHAGAASASREPTPASRALAAASRERPLTVFLLGPATNLATALQEEPELAARLERVVLVVGRRGPLRFPGGDEEYGDFNFDLDPDAVATVLGTGAPITLVPFEFAVRAPVTEADWSRLWDAPFARVFRGPIEDYLDWFEERTGVRATYPFDSYAVASVVAPDLLDCAPEAVVVRGGALIPADGGRPVRWCHAPRPGLQDDLLRRLGRAGS